MLQETVVKMAKCWDYRSRRWVRRDGDDRDVIYEEIRYLCCHFAKNYMKTLSRIVIKYVEEVFFFSKNAEKSDEW